MNDLRIRHGWQRRSIFTELMLVVILFTVGLSGIVGNYALNQFHHASEREYLDSLSSLADQKEMAINRYIANHLGRVETLAMLPLVQQALPAFSPPFYQDGVNSTAYKAINDKFGNFFERYLEHWGYYDLFLIDVGGSVVYSIKHESDFATNLNDGLYKDSGLAKVFYQASRLLQSNNSSLEYYTPSDAVAGFVATPVLKDGVLVGVIALQFDHHELYEVINNYTGLGSTGEMVLGYAQTDRIIMTVPLRHDPDAAFKRQVAMDADNALPIRESSRGIEGQGVLQDWRGKEVLAVWQYLPSLQWGMVLKIDTEEAFGYWYGLRSTLIVYLMLAVLLTCLALFFMIRRIVNPIRKLTHASDVLARDGEHVDVSALLKYGNEVGVLARAFSDMAQRVMQSKDELMEHNRLLDEQVAYKTEHVRAAVDGSSDGIIILNEQGIIERVNPAAIQMFGYAEKELLGMHMLSLMPEGYRDKKILNVDMNHDNLISKSFKAEWKGQKKSRDIFPIDFQLN
ncbi:MAG: PAS domain S-box protein, partial [Mariprofundaceae bacterium]